MVSTVRGRFGAVEGTLVLDRDHATNSHVDVKIEVASIDTRNEQRDGHLRSADFFDSENHSHITFRSTLVVPTGGEKYKFMVTCRSAE
jgi:polyisoprenoid-binding protein YceI